MKEATIKPEAAKEIIETAANALPEAKVAPEKEEEISLQARYELISNRAYYLFEQRGYVHGFDREDWEEAEKQLKFESLN